MLHWNRVPFGLSALVTPVPLHICPYFAYSHLLSPAWWRAHLTGSHLPIRPHMGSDAPARWSTGALPWLKVIYLAERNFARSIPVLSFLSFSMFSFDLTPISAVLLQKLTHDWHHHCRQERAQVSPECTLASSLSARWIHAARNGLCHFSNFPFPVIRLFLFHELLTSLSSNWTRTSFFACSFITGQFNLIHASCSIKVLLSFLLKSLQTWIFSSEQRNQLIGTIVF